MELLLFVLLWPLLIFAVGVVGVAYLSLSLPWVIIIALIIAIMLAKKFVPAQEPAQIGMLAPQSTASQLEAIRAFALVFSISLLWPVFSRFLVEALDAVGFSLEAVIAVLVVGFSLVTWGMFMKDRRAIMYSNIFGGALTVLYAYSQIWELGEGAKVIAAAFGLIVAVGVAVFKFRDKLK